MSQLASAVQIASTAALLAIRGFSPAQDPGLANDTFGPDAGIADRSSLFVAAEFEPTRADAILDNPHAVSEFSNPVSQEQLNTVRALRDASVVRAQTPTLPGEAANYMVSHDPFDQVTLPALGGLAASQF